MQKDITLNQLRYKIIKQCKEKGYCYLDRDESNWILLFFEKVNARYNEDLPKAKNNRPYKLYKLMLETRRGDWFVNFTLNAIRSETFEEFLMARPDQIWK